MLVLGSFYSLELEGKVDRFKFFLRVGGWDGS